MIAFHFPPQTTSSGVHRTSAFAKTLGTYGWRPVMLTANAFAYPVMDKLEQDDRLEQIVVKRAFAFDAKRHMGVVGRYPGVLAIPDRWISWLFSAVPLGLILIRKYNPVVIWSTYPIPTALLIGLVLHKITKKPWVIDLRDPMLQDDYPITRLKRLAYQWLERHAIVNCHKAIFTSHAAMEDYQLRFSKIPKEKFQVIENGYDEEIFSECVAESSANLDQHQHEIFLLHSGTLYNDGRDPSCFLEALSVLKARGKLDSMRLRITLRATGNDEYVKHLIKKHNLESIVNVAPTTPYKEALREMLSASGLIIFQGATFNKQIPAKTYEYFRARKPIYGLVDTQGETARILSDAGFTELTSIDNTEDIIVSFDQFLSRVRKKTAYIANEEVVHLSSRTYGAAKLASVLTEIEQSSLDNH